MVFSPILVGLWTHICSAHRRLDKLLAIFFRALWQRALVHADWFVGYVFRWTGCIVHVPALTINMGQVPNEIRAAMHRYTSHSSKACISHSAQPPPAYHKREHCLSILFATTDCWVTASFFWCNSEIWSMAYVHWSTVTAAHIYRLTLTLKWCCAAVCCTMQLRHFADFSHS